ncbi:hypothetical protein OUZ56_009851 [Daphnia magna]|uniref:Uncharacterized protein n=1 Tax=Daphnia magna TaxID=35525 RepID=A0ABR0AH74_9CRUS|nr:hypothetical protein OUZ56_009851 [Daphnia magna]
MLSSLLLRSPLHFFTSSRFLLFIALLTIFSVSTSTTSSTLSFVLTVDQFISTTLREDSKSCLGTVGFPV